MIVTATVLAQLLAPPAKVARPRPPKPVKLEELAIEAATTEYDGLGHLYTVRGKVRISLRELAVTCTEARIMVAPDESRVDRIVFDGNVVATRGRSTFKGDRITFVLATRKLTAEGNTRTSLFVPAADPTGTQGKQP